MGGFCNVNRAANHRTSRWHSREGGLPSKGAGRYIVIRHGREYQTVYMHLSKPLVKVQDKQLSVENE